MANFTEHGNDTSTLNQTSIFPAGRGVFWYFLFAINIVLPFIAILSNALVLVALRKVSSLHRPSKLLFGCLAVTDLGVGLIPQPLFAIVILGHSKEIDWNIYIFAFEVCRTSTIILCQVSLFTSTAISVDRLLALLLGLRYRHFVTFRRVTAIISCFWLIAVSGSFVYLFLSWFVAFIAAAVLGLLSIVISVFSYTKIFLTLRQQQAQVQAHVQGPPNRGGMPLNLVRYKKTVSIIAWVQLTLVACCVPFGICVIVIAINGMVMDFGWHTSATFFYFNSSLNPLLYCWKIKELRQEVKGTIKKLCCGLN